ncbi:MAG: hypothetical protein APF84_10000 [Gracilibacter sp. BRH_c7a]|nr:MAG: hypothetical protein APF84_10000 [Gracilibacter sp. BRH_c7a]
MRKSKKLTTLPIAGAFIGTVVGAGFATGQEVFQFFTVFGWYSFIAIFLTSILFSFFGMTIMKLSRKIHVRSHLDLVKSIAGRKLGLFLDWIITLSFFGVLVVMAAGAGAIAKEQLGLPPFIGSLFILLLTFCVVLSGLDNVIRAIGLVVPFLLLSVLGVALYSIIANPIIPQKIQFLSSLTPSTAPNWYYSSILYVSYNIFLSVAILSSLGVMAKDTTSLTRGALLGGLGLGIGLLAINLALVSGLPQILDYEVPMIYLASFFSPLLALSYGVILLLEIFTTTVSILFGLVVRLATTSTQRFFWAMTASLCALLASQIGFSKVVLMIYPVMGYVGVILLLCLLGALRKTHK